MPTPQHYEFAISAGPGRLMDYGVTDNQHTLGAKTNLASLKAAASNTSKTVRLAVSECAPDCPTGQ